MIGQACVPLGFVSVAATTATAAALASVVVTGTTHFVVPAKANMAIIAADSGSVRWRDDGVAPTPTAGMVIPSNAEPFVYTGNISGLSFISVSGTASVGVSLYKVAG